MSYRTEGGIFVRPWGAGHSKGRQGLGGGGVAGSLEQGSWGLGRVSKGLGDWSLGGAEGVGGLDPRGTGRMFGRTFGRSLACSDRRKFPTLFYRTSSPSDPLPKKEFKLHPGR